MHELSIAQEIIGIVQENLPKQSGHAVKSVKLRIGKLTNILPDSLEFCFDALIKSTPLDGARLEIQHIPVTVCCTQCKKENEIEGLAFVCPSCGSSQIKMTAGDELQVAEIEISD
jgi:hydrogenase nickel incorporation protein HypA/HybF